jgi:hypothetical protein
MAPYNLRGALNILFQLAVTIGIFAAQLINYGTQVGDFFAAACASLSCRRDMRCKASSAVVQCRCFN